MLQCPPTNGKAHPFNSVQFHLGCPLFLSRFFIHLIIFKFPFSVFLILYDVISNEFAITSPAYILFSCIICFTPKQNFMKLIIFTYILVLKFFYLFILMNVIDSKSFFYFRSFLTTERFLVIYIIVGFLLLSTVLLHSLFTVSPFVFFSFLVIIEGL